MAVETGAIFNSIVFGGVNSADYGIYVTGDAVYDAPKRATKLVSVPGRNGAIAIDQGYWENITLTYPAGVFGDDQQDFAEAIRAYRNAVASKIGYQRLTDTYHPREFRMAMFIDGMEVDPKSYGRAGQFSLKFECKPQRWLTSGETTVTVASGDVLTNPTLYGASPLLAVDGYGTIQFNGYEIELESGGQGYYILRETGSQIHRSAGAQRFELNTDLYNAGDTITIENNPEFTTYIKVARGLSISSYTVNSHSGDGTVTVDEIDSDTLFVMTKFDSFSFASNASFTKTDTWNATVNYGTYSSNVTITAEIRYIQNDNAITFRWNCAFTGDTGRISANSLNYYSAGYSTYGPAVSVYSTKTIMGHPTYIDCDLGEVYKEEGETVVDLNSYVDLGSDLPVLKPGDNEITYDNTITSLKITPRWWQL